MTTNDNNDKIVVEAGTLEAEESEEFEAKFRTRPAPLRGAADLKADASAAGPPS